MHYDSSAKSFTPVYSWKCNGDSSVPIAPSKLTDDLFATFNLTSVDLDDYNNFDNFPWSFQLSWTPPTNSSLSFGWLYDYYSGCADSTCTTWVNQDSDEDLLSSEDGDTNPTSYTLTVKDSDTLVKYLENITFVVSYQDSSADNDTNFQTSYNISSWDSGSSNTTGSGSVSGSITVPSTDSGKTYFVFVDNDINPANGWIGYATSISDGSGTISYLFSDIAAGSYYVYAVMYGDSTTAMRTQKAGDYTGGNTVTVMEGATATCNFPLTLVGDTTTTAGAVSGTITVPSTDSGKTYFVFVDNDTNPANGFINSATGTSDGSGMISYSFSDLAAGSYYVYAVMYGDNTTTMRTQTTGDYTGGNMVIVTAAATATCNLTLTLITDTTATTGTVSGTITLPSSVTGKTYYVAIADSTTTDEDVTYNLSTVTGNTIDYTLTNVPAGNYYVYCMVWATATEPQDLTDGDFYGATSTFTFAAGETLSALDFALDVYSSIAPSKSIIKIK